MAGIGAAVAVHWLSTRDDRAHRFAQTTLPMWAAASMIGVAAGLLGMTSATREYLDDFWRTGFPPWPLEPSAVFAWLGRKAVEVFADPTLLRYRWPTAFAALAVLGFGALWRQQRVAALLLLGPFVVAVTAAIGRQYPLGGRLMTYLLPGAILAVAAGAGALARWGNRFHPAAGGVLLVLLLAPPVAAFFEARPPYEIEHHRAVLAHLQRHRTRDDVVHVFPLSRIGMLFYGPQYGVLPHEWTTGICDRDDTTRAYLRDVDRYRGARRVWVLSTTARAFRVAGASVHDYLSTIGVVRDSVTFRSFTMGSVSLRLYDLGDPARLAAADSGTFPAPPMPTDPRPGVPALGAAGAARSLHQRRRPLSASCVVSSV